MPGTPAYRFDPSRDESRAARLVVDNVLKRAAGRPDPWSAREGRADRWLEYVDWLIPGILCLGIMNNGMWSIGFMTVQARLRRLLKRLAASPMRKRDYLLAQILARLALLAPEVAVPLVFGVLAFGMPINGSIADIAIVSGRRTHVRGVRAAGRKPRPDHRGHQRLDESVDPADVGVERRVLLGVELSLVRPARDQGAAADRIRRRDARRRARGQSLGAIRVELLMLVSWGVACFAIALRLFKWR